MKKRMLALILVLALCLVFSGCTLGSMRKSHAVNTEEGKIVYNGVEYLALPHNVKINAKLDYEKQVYVTKPDVPLLLQKVYGHSAGISIDGRFLEGWYGETYCRSDCYEQYKDFDADSVALDRYCYEYYTQEGRQFYLLTQQQTEQLNKLLAEAEESLIEDDDFYTRDVSWIVGLEACSEDIPVSNHLYEVYMWDGQYCLLRFDDEGNTYLMQLPAEATATLDAIFAAVNG